MKIKLLLEEEHSKKQMMKIVRVVGNDQKKFDELISFCFGDDSKLGQRASWPVRYCVESHPEFIKKHLKKILQQLKKESHNAIRRNLVRSLELIDIPASLESKTISICFDLLNAKDEFVVVKVFAMTVLGKFCKKYPELIEELRASIETQIPYETAAFRARARMVIKNFSQSPQRNAKLAKKKIS